MESKIVKEPRTVQQWGTHHLFPVQARDMTYKLLFYLFWNCRIGYTCAFEHNHADGEERDLVNIFASLSLKPSNLPARDAPWKWVTSPFKMLHMCILSWFQQLMLWFELELIYCLVLEVDQKNVAWEYVWFFFWLT